MHTGTATLHVNVAQCVGLAEVNAQPFSLEVQLGHFGH